MHAHRASKVTLPLSLVPRDGLGDAFGEIDHRFPAKQFFRFRNVGLAVEVVAGAGGLELGFHVLADDLVYGIDEIQERDRPPQAMLKDCPSASFGASQASRFASMMFSTCEKSRVWLPSP